MAVKKLSRDLLLKFLTVIFHTTFWQWLGRPDFPFFTAFFTGRIAVFHGAKARENPIFHEADTSVKNSIREKRPREKREIRPSKPLP